MSQVRTERPDVYLTVVLRDVAPLGDPSEVQRPPQGKILSELDIAPLSHHRRGRERRFTRLPKFRSSSKEQGRTRDALIVCTSVP
jgi:hypothetical protein